MRWNRIKERKKILKLFYTQSQADTEHLKMAPLRRHPCGFITAQRWLLLTASVSQNFGKSGQHNSSVKLNHNQFSSLPLWCEPSSAWLVWRFLHYRSRNLLPQHKSLWKSNRQMPAHVALSQASLPALLNRTAPVGPVPNLSKSVFQQIIGSKGREITLLFLPVWLKLCFVFSNLPCLIPCLLKYAVHPPKNYWTQPKNPRPFSLWDKVGQKRMNVKQAVTESKNLRMYETSA